MNEVITNKLIEKDVHTALYERMESRNILLLDQDFNDGLKSRFGKSGTEHKIITSVYQREYLIVSIYNLRLVLCTEGLFHPYVTDMQTKTWDVLCLIYGESRVYPLGFPNYVVDITGHDIKKPLIDIGHPLHFAIIKFSVRLLSEAKFQIHSILNDMTYFTTCECAEFYFEFPSFNVGELKKSLEKRNEDESPRAFVDKYFPGRELFLDFPEE